VMAMNFSDKAPCCSQCPSGCISVDVPSLIHTRPVERHASKMLPDPDDLVEFAQMA
jgi:hypothetical protein